jgi:hypothetical protein
MQNRSAGSTTERPVVANDVEVELLRYVEASRAPRVAELLPCVVPDIPARDLHDDVSAVLRRVESAETLASSRSASFASGAWRSRSLQPDGGGFMDGHHLAIAFRLRL